MRDHRELIERGLASINAGFPGPPATIDAIESACLKQQAFLFLGPAHDEFVVLLPRFDHLRSCRYVVMWLAFSERGNASAIYRDDIDQLARDIGASYIEFTTARAGFERIAPAAGYRKTSTTYAREVPNGR